LPHFSRVHAYSPKRLHFYLLEATKFIAWITLPTTLIMAFFSQEIFSTIFLSEQFTLVHVHRASMILLALLPGLFFLSLNKILLSIFYSMHVTWIPAIIALCTTVINVLLNILFINQFQAAGLAAATAIASVIQTILFLLILRKKYHFRMYIAPFVRFIAAYILQLAICGSAFIILYYAIHHGIIACMPTTVALFFTAKIGLWLWVGPLTLAFFALLYYSRTLFRTSLHFLKHY
jgi:peptidoglycan biosynthesis protein MviN/MurJ (putative lipid II flippase)